MGMIGRILTAVAGAKLVQGAMARRATDPSPEYLPATQPDASSGAIATRANAVVGRAKDFYTQNPKLVHTLGAAAVAIALASFAKRRGVL